MITGEIALGQLIAPAITLIGAVGVVFTLRQVVLNLGEKASRLDTRIDKTELEVDALRRQVDRECVQRSELKEVEGRIDKRLHEVEHTVRNIPMQVVGLLNQGITSRTRRRTEP